MPVSEASASRSKNSVVYCEPPSHAATRPLLRCGIAPRAGRSVTHSHAADGVESNDGLDRWVMTDSSLASPIPLIVGPMVRVALSAHLGLYKGMSRLHTESDLDVFLCCCGDRGLAVRAARRVDLTVGTPPVRASPAQPGSSGPNT